MIRPYPPAPDPIFEPLLLGDFAQRLVDYHLSNDTVLRLESLRARANEGTISLEERTEYENFVESIDLVAILQAKARAALDRQSS